MRGLVTCYVLKCDVLRAQRATCLTCDVLVRRATCSRHMRTTDDGRRTTDIILHQRTLGNQLTAVGEIAGDSVQLFGGEALLERRHVGVWVHRLGIGDPAAQGRLVVLGSYL